EPDGSGHARSVAPAVRVGTPSAPSHAQCPEGSGRIEARIGLRMMPTFPRSPLSFRTASFPQYGWKAGLSDGAFPTRRAALAWSRHALVGVWFASVLRAPRALNGGPALRRACGLDFAPPFSGFSTYPRGPRSGSGCSVPARHHLIGPIRPTRGHIVISPHGGLY